MSAFSRTIAIVRESLADERARAAVAFRSDAADFLPAALEIVETPVSPTGRLTAWLLMAGLVVTIAWLAFGHVDVVATAPGKLVPVDSVKLIQPADAGVVRRILVRDGQSVVAGQPLVQLDPTISTADTAQARKALETSELDAARERAVLGAIDGQGLRFVPPPGTARDVAETQMALARAEYDGFNAAVVSNVARRNAAAATERESRIQAAKLSETIPLLDEQIAANEQLLTKGYVSKLKVIEMRRQRLGAARDRDAAFQSASRAVAEGAVAQGSLAQSRAEARAKILGEIAKAEADARLRREELAKATQRSSLQTLTSPVDGTVAQLAIHTVGGVVEATKPLMIVVPRGGTLVAEVRIANRDIGFIRPGQNVAIKLEAFPFTRYGTLKGRVESIGSDAVEDEKLGLLYPARIAIKAPQPGDRGEMIRAAVGMQVTADIRTGRRSILSYLLSPIDEVTKSAGRER